MLQRICVSLLLLVLAGCATVCPQNKIVTPKPKNTLRFATYNIYWENHGKDKRDPNSIIHIVSRINPDIIVFQETHCCSTEELKKHFNHSHRYQLFRNCDLNGNEDGLGILSKYPIVKDVYIPPVYGWFPAWLYIIKTPTGLVQVLNVHLNPQLVSDNNVGIFCEGIWATYKFRLMEICYYHRFLNPNLPTIIAGDFNENDHGAATNYLRDHGFDDAVLNCVPQSIKTWIAYYACFTFSGRYDRIYTTHLKTQKCQVYHHGYSDHFPVILDLKR